MAVWHIAVLIHALNEERKQIGNVIVAKCKQNLLSKVDALNKTNKANPVNATNALHLQKLATMLDNAAILFASFVDLAQLQPKETVVSGKSTSAKTVKWSFPTAVAKPEILNMFMLPLQAYLTMTNISTMNHCNTNIIQDTSVNNGPEEYIRGVNEQVEVANSKAKPKTLTIYTSKGNSIKFLCKQVGVKYFWNAIFNLNNELILFI